MVKIDKLLYGDEIEWALRMDEMLKRASDGALFFECQDPNNMSKEEEMLWHDIRYLVNRKFVCPNVDGGYSITGTGSEFVSRGGFRTEAKRSKNDIYAFRISVVAIILSAISLVVAIFEFCTRH